MKWVKVNDYEHILGKEGSTRRKTRFLLFPKTINQKGKTITRWLETATWTEEFRYLYFGTLRSEIESGQVPSKYAIDEGRWIVIRWFDTEETVEDALNELPLLGSKR